MATKKPEVRDPGVPKHTETPLVLHPTPRDAKLQASHDLLLQHLTTIIGQIVWGHHGVTRLQALMALSVMRDACDLQEHRGEEIRVGQLVRVTPAYIQQMMEQAER